MIQNRIKSKDHRISGGPYNTIIDSSKKTTILSFKILEIF